jgi:hypothetical protein
MYNVSDAIFDYDNYFYLNKSHTFDMNYLRYYKFSSRQGQLKQRFNIELLFFTYLKNLRLAYTGQNSVQSSKPPSLSLLPTLIETNESILTLENGISDSLTNSCILCILNLNLNDPNSNVYVNNKKYCKYCYYYFYDFNSSNIKFAASKFKSDEHFAESAPNFSFYEFKSGKDPYNHNNNINHKTESYPSMDVESDHITSLVSFNPTSGSGAVKSKHLNGSLTDISSLDGSINCADNLAKKKK